MDGTKKLYVESYIKQAVQEKTGTNRIDKSVFEAVQSAIKAVLARPFTVENGRARLASDPVPDAVEPELPDMTEQPRATKSGTAGSPDAEHVVLVKIAGGTVYSSHSDTYVLLYDLDRIGKMVTNRFYDAEIRELISVLRQIAPKIKDMDCKYEAAELERAHFGGAK